ncbi:ultraviolet-B receptor UVR8-like isoform X2 [Prosopis cineraria]|uniref:ultraviolet-B receptor UVR8-like isoform X2 n=1 Tax=Prosopis cineraria TaxID=364024 RepID=UPI0024109894|nr:ultraviolet-B receptor UVR8-like isoform X2 [Prosopis cineraria]
MNGNEAIEDEKMDKHLEKLVYTWGYLPGALPEKAPILSPVPVRLSDPVLAGDSWKDVCGGGCGFAMAISENGKLITWGAADDESQSYSTSGKHGETPEPFPVPTEASVVKAAAGWAHCVSVTEQGEVYAWGWKECVPSGKIVGDFLIGRNLQKDAAGKQSSLVTEQGSPQGSNTSNGSDSQLDNKKVGEETIKRRKISPARLESDSPSSGDEFFTVSPSLITFGHGVKITTVAAGGRHTLALSDVGQVWGWGYGGEGQLGLGSRVKMVSSPHLIPCIEPSTSQKDKPSVIHQGGLGATTQASKVPGTYVKEIACGGRHSAIITDVGALLTFGWGLYGQCGQGSTADQLRPTCVPSLLGTRVEKAAAGLWHTLCVTVDGHLYSFGGNQFGQLGTGSDHLEASPRLLDASCLENKHSSVISCGARHSAVLTDDGQFFTWGWNKYGQLGLGDSVDRNIPCQVSIGECRPRNIACGWWHTLLVAEKSV